MAGLQEDQTAGHQAGRQLHLQICLSQVNHDDSREDSVIHAWKIWTKYDSEAAADDDDDDDDDSGDRRDSITGRFLSRPSTRPFCVHAALNILVASMHQALSEGKLLL